MCHDAAVEYDEISQLFVSPDRLMVSPRLPAHATEHALAIAKKIATGVLSKHVASLTHVLKASKVLLARSLWCFRTVLGRRRMM